MNSAQKMKRSAVPAIAESLLLLSEIPLSLALIIQSMMVQTQVLEGALTGEQMAALEAATDPAEGRAISAALFLILAAVQAIRAFRGRERRGRGFFAVSLAQAGLLLIGAALPLAMGFKNATLIALGIAYALALGIGRVYAILRDRRLRSAALNILCILGLAGSCFIFMLTDLLILCLALLSLMKIVFGRIRLHTLKRIIRKTYAAEIIFGLLLLIITFSFLLYYFDPGIESMRDALWYCFAIVTTIGFGDLTAVTTFGRVLSVILGIYGIVVVALITSIIVNFYGETKKEDTESEGD